MKKKLGILLIVLALFGFTEKALAACTSPDGNEGEMVYNTTHKVMQYCNGTNKWVAMVGASPGPQNCTTIGDLCDDGTIFAGDTNMYVTTSNQSLSSRWKTTTGSNDINPDSNTDGIANHANRSGTLSNFPAMATCENLTAHGHSDWYLPALNELASLYTNRVAINASASEAFTTSSYWSSSESSTTKAKLYRFYNGGLTDTDTKTVDYDVRCVRRSSSSALSGATCTAGEEGDLLYNSTSKVLQFCNGTSWISTVGPGSGSGSSLIGYWKVDETTGTSATDSSGNSYTGTLNGTTFAAGTSSGKIGTAVTLDGSNDYITVNDNAFDNLTAVTACVWIKRTATNTNWAALIAKSTDGYDGWHLYIKMDGSVVGFYNPVRRYDEVNSAGTIPLNTWTHVCGSSNGGSSGNDVKVYVNGVIQSNNEGNNGTLGSADDSSKALGIGAGPDGSSAFNGVMDEVRVFNEQLSDAEITEIYNDTVGLSTPGVSGASCTSGEEGDVIYNPTNDTMQFCNGTNWIATGY